MGLDMYLCRTKRINGITIKQAQNIEAYLSWRDNERARKYTLEEWSGVREKDVPPQSVIKYYEEQIKNTKDEEVGYWRKANQIHNWFVENVQDGEDDCGSYEVSKWQLEELLDICKLIKNKCKLINGRVKVGEHLENGKWVADYEDGQILDNAEIAEEYLPTRSGFFFGGTDYDEWYMGDIDDTIQIIEKVLDETDFETQIVFYSSSW